MKCFNKRHPELLSHEEQQLYQGNTIFGKKKTKKYHCFKGANQTFSIPVILGRLIHNT